MTPTTVPARDVAAEIRRRLPGVGVKKLHKLLYYCQGHHLAAFGTPLFAQSVSAWDMGPVVGELWHEEKTAAAAADPGPLDQAGLNTVGYVLSRYGRLTGRDLEVLSHGEAPWQEADRRRSQASKDAARISPEIMTQYFASDVDDEPDVDPAELKALLAGAPERRRLATNQPDDIERLRRRLLEWQQTA
jgi:uncharacterized phage-associated protein